MSQNIGESPTHHQAPACLMIPCVLRNRCHVRFHPSIASFSFQQKPAVSSDKLRVPQHKPDPQAVLDALGIRSWQFDLAVPQSKPRGLAIYSKAEHKEPIAINGTTILNFKGAPRIEKITVTVALQTISSPKGEICYLPGMTTSNGASWTHEIESLFSPKAAWGTCSGSSKAGRKGRVIFAYSEGANSIGPGDQSPIIQPQSTCN